MQVDAAWQVFAANNNLTFKSYIPLIRDYYVTGNYGLYNFRLETFSRSTRFTTSSSRLGSGYSSERIYTRMTLRAVKPITTVSSISEASLRLDRQKIVDLLIPPDAQQVVKGRFYAYKSGREIVYEQEHIEARVEYLQFVLGLLKSLIEVYPHIIELGGEVVPAIYPISKKHHMLQHVAGQVVFDIGKETAQQLKKRASHLLCPHCLVHCGMHQINVSWIGDITYYGCRACSQSRNLTNSDNYRLVVCLDRDLLAEQTNRDMTIWVNWIKHPKLFDFEEVEIVKATDEDVERFAVQVGNDTDPIRKPQYKQMRCKVSAVCQLSENTTRILQRTFGQVEVNDTTNSYL